MPIQARRDGDTLLVDNVDLKRAARNLANKMREPGWKPPADLNQAMELVARSFGYANLLAANLQAEGASAPTPVLGFLGAVPTPEVARPQSSNGPKVAAYCTSTWSSGASPIELPVDPSTVFLDMQTKDATFYIDTFRKASPKSNAFVVTNIDLTPGSKTTAKLVSFMAAHPRSSFNVLFDDAADARKFFSTWTYPDNTQVFSSFELHDTGTTGGPVHEQTSRPTIGSAAWRGVIPYPQPVAPAQRLAPWGSQEQDREVFISAVQGMSQPGEIAAIIGGPATGKLALAGALVESMGGAVVDFGVASWRQHFDAVLKNPPGLVVIDSLYFHSAATEQEVLEFARKAHPTKVVFVFASAEHIQAIMAHKDASGENLFHKAHVLDTDFKAFSTLVGHRAAQTPVPVAPSGPVVGIARRKPRP